MLVLGGFDDVDEQNYEPVGPNAARRVNVNAEGHLQSKNAGACSLILEKKPATPSYSSPTKWQNSPYANAASVGKDTVAGPNYAPLAQERRIYTSDAIQQNDSNTCAYASGQNRPCNKRLVALWNSVYCVHHTCVTPGCGMPKSSGVSCCPVHAESEA